MSLPFALPPLSPGKPSPEWVGNGFRTGDDFVRILEYSSNDAGWSDDLTSLHEEVAGSDHFIDQASRQHALEQLRKHVRSKSPVILEIGCSSGFLLCAMKEHFPNAVVMGSDVVIKPMGELGSHRSDLPLFRFDLVKCPFPDNCLDAVVLLNVLEHIENDSAAMEQVCRILKPNGVVIIELPAGPHLYDAYDQLLMHFRRYTLSDLRRLAVGVHLQVIEQSHLGFLLYPGFRLIKYRNKRLLFKHKYIQLRTVKGNIGHTGNSILLRKIMKLELSLGRLLSFPFGIRCLLTCIKPEA
jgi:SAM-dependent methyltransferase